MPMKVCARSAGSWTACASTIAPSLPSSTALSTQGSWWCGCSSPSPTPRRSGAAPTSRTRIGAPPSSSCGRASRAEPRYRRGMPDPAVGDLGPEALAYADALHNLARYLTGNDTDAEDLVQETYSRALGSAGQFTPGTNLKAWLFRILRNTFISQYRRQRGNPTVGGLDTVAPIGYGPADVGRAKDEVELDRLRKVMAEEIERALMTLTDDARTAILLTSRASRRWRSPTCSAARWVPSSRGF